MGSYGVSSGAAIATNTTIASKMRPPSRVRLSAIWCNRRGKPTLRGAERLRATLGSRTFSLIGHARIQHRVREIDQQIDENDHDCGDDSDRLDDRVIATRDGCEQQLTEARDGKHGLDNQR